MASFVFIILILAIILQCILALPPPLNVPLPKEFAQYTVLEQRDTIPDPWIDEGSAPSDQVISLGIGFKLQNLQEFERRFTEISTPDHQNYQKHMTADQVHAMLNPAEDTVKLVLSWLKAFGIEGTHDHQWIKVELAVAQANTLLQAQYKIYRDRNTGKSITRTQSYSIPSSLLDIVDFVTPATSFEKDLRPSKPSTALKLAKRQTAPVCANQVTPSCIFDLYGIPRNRSTQADNSIAVSGFLGENANKADLARFLRDLRPDLNPAPTFAEVFIDGGVNPQDPALAGLEANLDIQYTVGIASGGRNDMTGFLDVANFLLHQPVVPTVLSIGYKIDERVVSQRVANNLCNVYMQLGARGTSVIHSSGDGGVAGVNVDTYCGNTFVPTFPSTCPFVTSVGATTGIQPEVGAGLSAGGFSNYFNRPQYQAGAVNSYINRLGSQYNGRYNANGRAYPDVAAQGMVVTIALGGQWGLVEGTSASVSIFASVIALLNDQLIRAGRAPMGFLNPFLYSNPGALNDIVHGNNPGCNTNGFSAVSGWDPVTGLGTPNFQRMLTALGF
ncbi:subtilisin-like protein [Gamsiella multidivaricata]|uniref:subtilisin-like protein n=1 Tax=Gamsiella multidivaricata TaxID=101098 RepID=UPI00221E4B2F|nr:subtilisin-like protein [Gamsiella multidivaricata]KAG0367272.1 hypothetical protein BGZ54_004131 [Gamsiella multidivaricata]KAI7823858.1 subtilisin-like protein [Gamsiella multidivaricata]